MLKEVLTTVTLSEKLPQYLKELIECKQDYNTSGYAIVKALLTTEMMIAHQLGTSGAQHGYANVAYITETRLSEIGCTILNFDDMMYPQYNLLEKVNGWMLKRRLREIKERLKNPKMVNQNYNLTKKGNESDFAVLAHTFRKPRSDHLVCG